MSRAVFFTASVLLYASTIIIATLTLNAYFAQTWDVTTFIHAARRFTEGGNPFDLYAQSHAAETWPYAYPPLHAFVIAIALLVGDTLHVLPDYVWARVPVILADIGVGLLLYRIVQRKSRDELLARIALLVWLFNPVTFYDTAVQGHFESEWLLCVLLAYAWYEESHSSVLPSIALAVAVLFKQVAILFAIPVWMAMLKAEGRRVKDEAFHPAKRSLILHPLARIAFSVTLFVAVVGLVCLPYLLYSNDFLYMNLTYVENVPVQTQSWIVALLGVTRASRDAFTSDFILLRCQTFVTLFAAAAIAFFAARRGLSLYLAGTLIALAFFLTSKKVMGYYNVILFPFAFAEMLPRKRFDLALITILATAWIALSPYYADWGNPNHWWIYALLGALNSALFVWMFLQCLSLRGAIFATKQSPQTDSEIASQKSLAMTRPTIFITLGLFAGAAFAAFLQPLAQNASSPIRAPIIAPGMEGSALAAFGALVALVVIALALMSRFVVGVVAPGQRAQAHTTIVAWAIVLVFAPLFFSAYYLTKESTAIFEIALKALGV
ncbi:MAG: hypothetical protein KGJ80_01030 [Chloroflexota bacterium]|nr:hypothetical protein [Chloroflexota bacterium]